MKRKFSDASLIEINVGDKVWDIRHEQECIVEHISIVPDGNPETNRNLIGLIAAKYVNGNKKGKIVATADKFEAIPNELYNVEYPSDLLK